MPARRSSLNVSSPLRQRGATALEFGLVFPALFVLFYGTLTFALIFTARMGLQHAAEEGARSAATFRIEGSEPNITQLTLRRDAARATALQQASWISRWAPLQVEARICAADSDCSVETTTCGRELADACKIFVSVTYPYATRPILPSAFGLPVPTTLSGEASLLLDGRLIDS